MSAVGVIGARNPVHSALFLVLTFFTVACTWILAGAEFLGLVLVLVYVGAVMVLFLFVVMMLDVDIEKMRKGYVDRKSVVKGKSVSVRLDLGGRGNMKKKN